MTFVFIRKLEDFEKKMSTFRGKPKKYPDSAPFCLSVCFIPRNERAKMFHFGNSECFAFKHSNSELFVVAMLWKQ